MKASKLRPLHIIIIGAVACAAVVAGLYFLVIQKVNADIKVQQGKYDAASAQYAKLAQTQRDLDNVRRDNAAINARYMSYLSKYMPSISFQNRAVGMIGLWREQNETLGPLIMGWPARTGVTMSGGVSVPAAPVDPNTIDTTLIKIPVGTVTVTGDFRTILSHIRSWKNFGRLVQVDPPSISGTSPQLSATYALTVLIFPRGEAGPNVTMTSGAAKP